jgi:hypothetical protein
MAGKKGKVKHIRIEPDTKKGSRGAHITVSREVSEGTNKGPWLRSEDEEKQSHATPEAAAAHVLATLKEHFGAGGTSDDDGVEGAKASKGGKSAAAKAGHPASDDGPQASSDSWD